MIKEELEKEAEEKYSEVDREFIDCQDEGEVFNIGYILGAEPREKRIAELEKENAELKEKLEGAERARDYWKDSSFDWRRKCTSRRPFRAAVKAQKQLTEAKDLLNEFNRVLKEHNLYHNDLYKRTEQFLIEVEK